jgi:hypothetical protein
VPRVLKEEAACPWLCGSKMAWKPGQILHEICGCDEQPRWKDRFGRNHSNSAKHQRFKRLGGADEGAQIFEATAHGLHPALLECAPQRLKPPGERRAVEPRYCQDQQQDVLVGGVNKPWHARGPHALRKAQQASSQHAPVVEHYVQCGADVVRECARVMLQGEESG